MPHPTVQRRIGRFRGMGVRVLLVAALSAAALLPAACGYMRNVFLRGQVTDISGQALPGVVVRIADAEFEALTGATGYYSLGAAPGEWQVDFMKTGYTPVRLSVTVENMGIVELPSVTLWPLPMGEGVYWFRDFRYSQTSHPRPNRYRVKDMGVAFGTPVNPELSIAWVDPTEAPQLNPPVFIGHKMPTYDARMHKLQRANAALIQTAGGAVVASEAGEDIQYLEEVWVPERSLPVRSRSLDDAEKLLVELRPAMPLEPGVYALHWGALEGYDSVDPRIFIFEIVAPEPPDEASEEAAAEGEADSAAAEGDAGSAAAEGET